MIGAATRMHFVFQLLALTLLLTLLTALLLIRGHGTWFWMVSWSHDVFVMMLKCPFVVVVLELTAWLWAHMYIYMYKHITLVCNTHLHDILYALNSIWFFEDCFILLIVTLFFKGPPSLPLQQKSSNTSITNYHSNKTRNLMNPSEHFYRHLRICIHHQIML